MRECVHACVCRALPCGHDTDYSFCPDHFQTLHMHIVDDERRNPIDFGSRSQRLRSTLTFCCIKPCGHDTDFSYCPITFKLYMHIVDDERRNPIDFWSRGQRSTLTLLYKTLWA